MTWIVHHMMLIYTLVLCVCVCVVLDTVDPAANPANFAFANLDFIVLVVALATWLVVGSVFSGKHSRTAPRLFLLAGAITVVAYLPASNLVVYVGFTIAERENSICVCICEIVELYGMRCHDDFGGVRYSLSTFRWNLHALRSRVWIGPYYVERQPSRRCVWLLLFFFFFFQDLFHQSDSCQPFVFVVDRDSLDVESRRPCGRLGSSNTNSKFGLARRVGIRR